MSHTALVGDCRAIPLPDASVEAVVTDPPYGLAFMGKAWDHDVPGPDYWREVYRVMKPGAHLLAFGGTRTWHWLTVGIEEAGFELRDCLSWMYGTGFPKSHAIGRAIDREAGEEREVVGVREYAGGHVQRSSEDNLSPPIGTFERPQDRREVTAPATDEAERWEGWGTALKPGWEPIVLAMKPTDGTFAENALEHGVAGLNLDGCRIGVEPSPSVQRRADGAATKRDGPTYGKPGSAARSNEHRPSEMNGRWPANVTLSHTRWCIPRGTKRRKVPTHRTPSPKGEPDGSTPFGTGGDDRRDYDYADEDGTEEVEDWDCPPSCPVRMLDEQSGERPSGSRLTGDEPTSDGFSGEVYGEGINRRSWEPYTDTGGASRFYKVSRPYTLCTVCGCELPPRRGVSSSDPNREEPCKTTPATTAEPGSETTPATGRASTSTAPESAPRRDSVKNARSVSIAARTVCPRCEIATAQSGVPTRPSQGGRPSSGTTNRGTFGSPMLTRNGCESVTGAIRRNGSEPSPEARPAVPTPNLTHASGAVRRMPTATTTTTANPKKSGGSAGPATSKRTKPNTGAGAKVSPTRFRYCAKASRSEREAGLDGFEPQFSPTMNDGIGEREHNPDAEGSHRANHHPTVKPIDLCRWLVRLVTRKGHTVLDPFMGSGSIGCAALQERRRYIGLDLNPEYVEIARARLEHWRPKQVDMFRDAP